MREIRYGLFRILLMVAFIYNSSLVSTAVAGGVCEDQMAIAAARNGVPLGFLYAIGMTETGLKKKLHPWALNIQGNGFYPESREESYRIILESIKNSKIIDIGCMQINYKYHHMHFKSLYDMLDPSLNVDYAARYLKRLYRREKTWTLAAARYHAGPNRDAAQKRYVCVVIRNLAASGFGRWTPQAREFCK